MGALSVCVRCLVILDGLRMSLRGASVGMSSLSEFDSFDFVLAAETARLAIGVAF